MNEIREEARRMWITGRLIFYVFILVAMLIVLAVGLYFFGPHRDDVGAPYESQAVQGVACLDLDGDGKADAILGQKGTVFIPPGGKARVFPCPTAPREAVFRSGGWAGVDWAFWTAGQGK
jgi:hypothetical protein